MSLTGFINNIIAGKKAREIDFKDLTPVRKYEYEVIEENRINILVPKFTDIIFGRLLQPRIKDKYIKAELDEIGSSVWLLIDGKNNVDIIAENLKSKFGDKVHPVYERLISYLRAMKQNGFIYFLELKKG